MSPYRTQQPAPPSGSSEPEEPCPDADLMPVFLVVWCVSVARVALGVAHGETFAGEATLASMAVLGLPYLSKDALIWSVQRWFRRRAP